MDSTARRSNGRKQKQAMLEKLKSRLAKSELSQAELWLQTEHEKIDEKLKSASHNALFGNSTTQKRVPTVDRAAFVNLAIEKFGNPENAVKQLKNMLKKAQAQEGGNNKLISLPKLDQVFCEQFGTTISREYIATYLQPLVTSTSHEVEYNSFLKEIFSRGALQDAESYHILDTLREWVLNEGQSRMDIISSFAKLDLHKTGCITIPLAISAMIHELECPLKVPMLHKVLELDEFSGSDTNTLDYLAFAKELTSHPNSESNLSDVQEERSSVPELEQIIKLAIIDSRLDLHKVKTILSRSASVGSSRLRGSSGLSKGQLARAIDQLNLHSVEAKQIEELFARYAIPGKQLFNHTEFVAQLSQRRVTEGESNEVVESVQQLLQLHPGLQKAVVKSLKQGAFTSDDCIKLVTPSTIEKALAEVPLHLMSLQQRKRLVSSISAANNHGGKGMKCDAVVDMLTKSTEELYRAKREMRVQSSKMLRSHLIRAGYDKNDFRHILGHNERSNMSTVQLSRILDHIGWNVTDNEELLEAFESDDGTVDVEKFVNSVYDNNSPGNSDVEGEASSSWNGISQSELRRTLRRELRIPFPVEQNLRKQLESCDTEHTGLIPTHEFLRLLIKLGLDGSKSRVLAKLTDLFDSESLGVVTWELFLDFYMSRYNFDSNPAIAVHDSSSIDHQDDHVLSLSDLKEESRYSSSLSVTRSYEKATDQATQNPNYDGAIDVINRSINQVVVLNDLDLQTLLKLFEIYDENRTGITSVHDVCDVFETLKVPVTSKQVVEYLFHHDLVIGNVNTSTEPKVEYLKLAKLMTSSNKKSHARSRSYSSPRNSHRSQSSPRSPRHDLSSSSNLSDSNYRSTRQRSPRRRPYTSHTESPRESTRRRNANRNSFQHRIYQSLKKMRFTRDDLVLMLEAHQLGSKPQRKPEIHLDDLVLVVGELVGEDLTSSLGEIRFDFPISVGAHRNKIEIAAFVDEVYSHQSTTRDPSKGKPSKYHRRRKTATRTRSRSRVYSSCSDSDESTHYEHEMASKYLSYIHEQTIRVLDKRGLHGDDLRKAIMSYDVGHTGVVSKVQFAKEMRNIGVSRFTLDDVETLGNAFDLYLLEQGNKLDPASTHSYSDGLVRYDKIVEFLVSPLERTTLSGKNFDVRVERLQSENKILKNNLKQFDLQFFEQVEDLKYNYQRVKTTNQALEQHVWTLCAATGVPPPAELSQTLARNSASTNFDQSKTTSTSYDHNATTDRIDRALSSSTVKALQHGKDPLLEFKHQDPRNQIEPINFDPTKNNTSGRLVGDQLRAAVEDCKSPADLVDDIVEHLDAADWANQGSVPTSQFCDILVSSFAKHQHTLKPTLVPATALAGSFDPTNSGVVQYREFLCVLRPIVTATVSQNTDNALPQQDEGYKSTGEQIREGILAVINTRQELFDLFRSVDRRGLGRISVIQLVQVLESVGVELTEAAVEAFAASMDFGTNNTKAVNWIQYHEIVNWVWPRQCKKTSKRMSRIRASWDGGRISRSKRRERKPRRSRSIKTYTLSPSSESSVDDLYFNRRKHPTRISKTNHEGGDWESSGSEVTSVPSYFSANELPGKQKYQYSRSLSPTSRANYVGVGDGKLRHRSPRSVYSRITHSSLLGSPRHRHGSKYQRSPRHVQTNVNRTTSPRYSYRQSPRSPRTHRSFSPRHKAHQRESSDEDSYFETSKLSSRNYPLVPRHGVKVSSSPSRSKSSVIPTNRDDDSSVLAIQDVFRSKVLKESSERSTDGSIDIHVAFALLDRNKDGLISVKELETALLEMNIPVSHYERNKLFESISGGSKTFTFEAFCEFLAHCSDEVYERRQATLHDNLLKTLQSLVYSGPTGFRIQEAFDKLDTMQEGSISRHQLGAVLEVACPIPVSDAELRELFALIDTNRNGRISYREFVDFVGGQPMSPLKGRAKVLDELEVLEDKVKEVIRCLAYDGDGVFDVQHAFKQFDLNGSGLLTTDEFMKALENLGFHPAPGQMATLLRYFDENNDGYVNFEEFLRFFTSQSHGKGIAELNKEESIRKQAQRELLNLETKVREKLKRLRVGPSLRPQFRRFDKNRPGELSYQEFYKMLKSLGFELDAVEEEYLASRLDSTDSGTISYIEFAAFAEGSMTESQFTPNHLEQGNTNLHGKHLSSGARNVAVAATRKLKRAVQMKQIDLRSVFAQHMSTGEGSQMLNKCEFQICFSSQTSIQLDSKEIDALFNLFSSPKKKSRRPSVDEWDMNDDAYVVDCLHFLSCFLDYDGMKKHWAKQAGKQLRIRSGMQTALQNEKLLRDTLSRFAGKRSCVHRSEFLRFMKQLGFTIPYWQVETFADMCVRLDDRSNVDSGASSSTEDDECHDDQVPFLLFPSLLYDDQKMTTSSLDTTHSQSIYLDPDRSPRPDQHTLGTVEKRNNNHRERRLGNTERGSRTRISSGISNRFILPVLLALKNVTQSPGEMLKQYFNRKLGKIGFEDLIQHFIAAVDSETVSRLYDFMLTLKVDSEGGRRGYNENEGIDVGQLFKVGLASPTFLEEALAFDCNLTLEQLEQFTSTIENKFLSKLRARMNSFSNSKRDFLWGFTFLQQGETQDTYEYLYNIDQVPSSSDVITFRNLANAFETLGVDTKKDVDACAAAIICNRIAKNGFQSATVDSVWNGSYGITFGVFVDWVAPLTEEAAAQMNILRCAIRETARAGGGLLDYRKAFDRLVRAGSKNGSVCEHIEPSQLARAIRMVCQTASRDVVDALVLRARKASSERIDFEAFHEAYCM